MGHDTVNGRWIKIRRTNKIGARGLLAACQHRLERHMIIGAVGEARQFQRLCTLRHSIGLGFAACCRLTGDENLFEVCHIRIRPVYGDAAVVRQQRDLLRIGDEDALLTGQRGDIVGGKRIVEELRLVNCAVEIVRIVRLGHIARAEPQPRAVLSDGALKIVAACRVGAGLHPVHIEPDNAVAAGRFALPRKGNLMPASAARADGRDGGCLARAAARIPIGLNLQLELVAVQQDQRKAGVIVAVAAFVDNIGVSAARKVDPCGEGDLIRHAKGRAVVDLDIGAGIGGRAARKINSVALLALGSPDARGILGEDGAAVEVARGVAHLSTLSLTKRPLADHRLFRLLGGGSRIRNRQGVLIEIWRRRLPTRVKRHRLRLAAVGDGCLIALGQRDARAVIRLDKYDVERPVVQHAVEGAFTIADSQRLGPLIPCKWDLGKFSFFIVVVVALVLIEGKAAVRSHINTDLSRIGRLGRILLEGSHRQDGAAAHKQRNPF